MLTDLMLTRQSKEYFDCFSQRSFYTQNLTRYHTLTIEEMQNDIPKELLFLSSLYSGWNSEKITREQFEEMEKKMVAFPAASLAKKLDNRNLIGLRKKLHELKIHKELMFVLRRKYGFETKETVNRTVRQEMDYLDIPTYIQEKVQASLREQGKDEN